MKKISMPVEKRMCSHCHSLDDTGIGTLAYYHEGGAIDIYYCTRCYGITGWDGKNKKKMDGEAYPNRDK